MFLARARAFIIFSLFLFVLAVPHLHVSGCFPMVTKAIVRCQCLPPCPPTGPSLKYVGSPVTIDQSGATIVVIYLPFPHPYPIFSLSKEKVTCLSPR